MGPKTNPPEERRDNNAGDRQLAWGAGLKATYAKVAQEPVPDKFLDMLKQIEDAEAGKR